MADSPRRRQRPLKPGFYAKYPLRRLSTEDEIRKLFHDDNILAQEQQGILKRKVWNHEFSVQLDNEGDLVRTVISSFVDIDGNEIALTHHYERRDGSIAASGLLDPKQILHNGILYYIEK